MPLEEEQISPTFRLRQRTNEDPLAVAAIIEGEVTIDLYSVFRDGTIKKSGQKVASGAHQRVLRDNQDLVSLTNLTLLTSDPWRIL